MTPLHSSAQFFTAHLMQSPSRVWGFQCVQCRLSWVRVVLSDFQFVAISSLPAFVGGRGVAFKSDVRMQGFPMATHSLLVCLHRNTSRLMYIFATLVVLIVTSTNALSTLLFWLLCLLYTGLWRQSAILEHLFWWNQLVSV